MPTPTLRQLREKANLRRAWRWIRSNSDANYKGYFRPLYEHFAVAEDKLLDDLAIRLKREVFEPQAATKLYLPKSSGILRPISLLCVEDQVVYQAAVNLVAEKLQPRVVQRYNKQVFGHLYAGKTSTWFYRKWTDGYRDFNNAARKAFVQGFVYSASFDLTACYDSLDHRVLRHFLDHIGFEPDFGKRLTEWLEKWTATSSGIFHNHGIPQGPLSSGLLSEVVLSHFDQIKLRGVDFRYFRYVDDIRLFAKSDRDLRRLLVALDLMSKDIGLFPQSGKISIHRVQNIDDELKTVSNPRETSISRLFVDQSKLLKRIEEVTPRYKIEKAKDVTRFKYLLAHANPSAKLTSRLWRVLENHPEFYRNVCNYLRRYKMIPRAPAEKVVDIVKKNSLYAAVRSEFIDAVDGRLPPKQDRQLASLIKKSWAPTKMHPDLQVAIGRYLLRTGHLSSKQIQYACRTAPSWWARATLINNLNKSVSGANALKSIVGVGIKDPNADVALAASWLGFVESSIPTGARKQWNKSAELLLKEVGLVSRSRAFHCGIRHALGKIDPKISVVDWRKLFGSSYDQAEKQIIEAVAASRVSITNFVNLLDVFDDLILFSLHQLDGTIGHYNINGIGSVLNAPTGRLAKKYPKTYLYAKEVHECRLQSMASHPFVKVTGKPTQRIRFSFLSKSRRLLREATGELKASGVC